VQDSTEMSKSEGNIAPQSVPTIPPETPMPTVPPSN
jgi:hypothetical protein